MNLNSSNAYLVPSREVFVLVSIDSVDSVYTHFSVYKHLPPKRTKPVGIYLFENSEKRPRGHYALHCDGISRSFRAIKHLIAKKQPANVDL